MPLSIAERLYRLPRGAQAAVCKEFGLASTTVSSNMRGVYPRPESEAALARYRDVQRALAAKYDPPLPVWDVFAEWDGPRDEQQEPGARRRRVART